MLNPDLFILILSSLAFLCVFVIHLRRSKTQKFFVFFDTLNARDRLLLAIMPFSMLLVVWEILCFSNMISLTYLPTPFASFKQIILLFSTKDFIIACGISLLRIITAFAFASIIGVAIGSVAGVFLKFRAAILPLNSAFRYIPPTAFISLIIIWFGIGEMAKIILIFLAILFYIVQMVADVVKLTPTVYIQAAEMIGLSKFKIFKEVVLKYSYPDIISVLRVNLGAAWTFLIVSELVASQNGLGFLIATSQRFLMTANLFGLLIILGFLGFLSDTLFEVYIKKAGHWRK